MNFQLGEYYFHRQDFTRAVNRYEQASIDNLSNQDISRMKFHQGYCYFTQQKFAQAKPLLQYHPWDEGGDNYIDANYYYGFLSFRDRQYGDALESFRIVENEAAYASVVPYYIAQIYYIQGRKEEALKYAEAKLKKRSVPVL